MDYIKVDQEIFVRFVAKSPEDLTMKSTRRADGLRS